MSKSDWFDCDLAVVDVETTGLDAKSERIIEIAVIHMRAGEVLESWGKLIDPKKPIPAEVTQLTGISQSDVDGQPTFDTVAQDVLSRLENRVVVAYNLPFDRGFISEELTRAGLRWPDIPGLDPLVFARELMSDARSKKLGAIAEILGIPLIDAHRATDDAVVAGKVLYALRDRLPPNLDELVTLQKQWAQKQEQQMARWRRRRQADNEPAAMDIAPKPVTSEDGEVVLGPAYIYGNEPDPVRFFYGQLLDVGSRR